QTDPVAWLEKQILISFPPGTELFRISMTGERGDDIRALVDAVADAYMQEIVYKDRNKTRQRIEQLEEIQTRYEDALKRKWKTVERLAGAVGSTDPHTLAIKQRIASESMAQAQKELIQTQSELRKRQTELRELQTKEKAAGPVPVATAVLDREAAKDPRIEQLLRQKIEAEQ